MNVEAAIQRLNDQQEHKFLLNLQEVAPVFIMQEPLNEETKKRILSHEDLVNRMRGLGIFGQEEVRGGYCIVRNNLLKYWGDSTTPIRGAGESLFKQSITHRPISLMDFQGNILAK